MPELALDVLRERLAALGVSAVSPLAGGASSLTFRGLLDDRPVVVKVAPPGVDPVAHRDVLRQARIIDELSTTDVPVPEVLLRDSGAPPETPPLFVMTMIDGTSFEPLFDPIETVDRDVPQRYLSAARVLAALHRVSPATLGLECEPVIDGVAELDRWCATLRTVDQALVPGWTDVADALRSVPPAPMRPAVVHGDFRLGNLLAVGSEITAVIDWEIWSVGDPRIDLGWFLANADPITYGRPSTYVDAVPTRADLLSAYGDVDDVGWFTALACFKSTATWALIIKHNRRRHSPAAEVEAMADVLPHLLRRAAAPTD